MSPETPLVYSCSGCSSAAQMANHLAVRTAHSGRKILALDGCVLACARACLAREGVVPDRHLVLSDLGVKKRKHADFEAAQADAVYREHVAPEAQRLHRGKAREGFRRSCQG
jgi:uncharacterized metal-binding protein